MSDRISVNDFLSETKDDVNSPTTSTFTSKMSLCRATIAALEESLDADRSALKKMKSSIKAMHNSGQGHVKNQVSYFENLENLGSNALGDKREPETDVGSAFLKMSVFTKELSALLKNLVSSINKHLLFPMESLMKGDLKGIRGDMKRPFDKSWKDYDNKVKQVEREKRQIAREAGMIRSEISGSEIAEEMKKERRMFQLQMCEYLIKANEIRTKKGVDFIRHLVEFYHDQDSFFKEGLKIVDQYRTWTEELTSTLYTLHQAQDEEKRQLVELRNVLKSVCDTENNTGKSQANVYSLHQLQGNKALGTEKSGFLSKRSEGLRKVWQKRRCFVADGILTISHNKTNKDPVKLNLLTSQLKLVAEDKKQFDLVSHNRTYRFMAEDEHDAMTWVSVLSNSKEDALNRVFGDASSGKGGTEQSTGLKELTLSIIDEVRRLPGNDICCDCDNTDPTWLSTNLGVLLCIECSGIHRDMGVHVSRIQSLTLDDLGTSELLLAYSIGNDAFNTIMEEKLELKQKPTNASDMEIRKAFIRGKYISRKYVVQTCAGDTESLAEELGQTIQSSDLAALLQLYGENADLCMPLPGYDDGETALHVAVSVNQDEPASILPLVDFLCQNGGSGLNKQTNKGDTSLHKCALYNNTESMKLLLRSKAKTNIENSDGETPLAICRRLKHTACEELLVQADSGKFQAMVHIDIMWNLTYQDDDDFVSDDELEDRTSSMLLSPMKTGTPDNIRQRPASFKDRPKHSSGDTPRLPPAVPPHQNISRSRAQTTAPASSYDHQQRRDSRPLHPPPAVPVKPDSLKDRPSLLLTPTYNAQKETDCDKNKLTPPVPPPKEAALSSSTKKFSTSSRNPLRHESSKTDQLSKSLSAPSDFAAKSALTEADSSNFVSPRRVLTSRPSFAKRQSLSTRTNLDSPLNKHRSTALHQELTCKFATLASKREATAARNNGNDLTPLSARSPSAKHRHSDMFSTLQKYRSSSNSSSDRTWPSETRDNPAKRQSPNGLSSPMSNGKTNAKPDDQALINQPSVTNEKSRSLPRKSSLVESVLSAVAPSLVPPDPLPRAPASASNPGRPRRVRAAYDCDADNQDELTFVENEVIVVTGVEDQEWWVGHIEHQPHRQGVFPVSFVEVLPD